MKICYIYLRTFLVVRRTFLLSYFRGCWFLEIFCAHIRGYIISSRSGHRTCSGCETIYNINATKRKFRQRNHHRIWLDSFLYILNLNKDKLDRLLIVSTHFLTDSERQHFTWCWKNAQSDFLAYSMKFDKA